MTPESPATATNEAQENNNSLGHQKISELTSEELLRKIIEAQHKGGCTKIYPIVLEVTENGLAHCKTEHNHKGAYCYSSLRFHILEILLDTEGCKAAYGEWQSDFLKGGLMTGKWESASYALLRAWHSGTGNNLRAALETSVSLLPK
jgi:hypothetical protein